MILALKNGTSLLYGCVIIKSFLFEILKSYCFHLKKETISKKKKKKKQKQMKIWSFSNNRLFWNISWIDSHTSERICFSVICKFVNSTGKTNFTFTLFSFYLFHFFLCLIDNDLMNIVSLRNPISALTLHYKTVYLLPQNEKKWS